jgi:hypothetical protein
MANKKQNLENFKKIQRGNLIPIAISFTDELAWAKAVITDALSSPLVGDLPKDESPKLDLTLAKNSKNPYERARAVILSKMDKSKRIEIEERERNKRTDARIYDEFVKEIIQVGDKFSLDKMPPSTDNGVNN